MIRLTPRRWLLTAAMAMGMAMVLTTLIADDTWKRRANLHRDLTTLQQENADRRTNVSTLRRQIKALRQRREVQEHTIRQELGFVGPNEVIIKIDP